MFANFRPPQNNAIGVYKQHFCAFSAAFAENPQRVNYGGRVLLPMDCLSEMAQLNLVYPLQFQINTFNGRKAWVGVLEFEAEGGQIIMPDWLFQQLGLNPGDAVRVQTVVLPQGGLVKLRPQSRRFIELHNPKQLLEKHFTQYPVLYKGSTIVLRYLEQDFLLDIMDVQDVSGKSVDAISTVNARATYTELKVDFDRPLDMPPSPVQAAPPAAFPTGAANVIGGQAGVQFTPLQFKAPSLIDEPKAEASPPPPEAPPAFVPFKSAGRTLSGRAPPPNPGAKTTPATPPPQTSAPPPSAAQANTPATTPAPSADSFKAFSGTGRSLR